MKRTISIGFLMSVIIFMTLSIATSKFQTSYYEGDKFGWPLVFFSAYNNHDLVTDQSLSVVFLLVDLLFAFAAGFGIIGVFTLFGHKRNKKATLA